MSGLKNTRKRIHNITRGKGFKTDSEVIEEKKAKVQAGKDKLFASADVPDDEAIKRHERRKAAKRAGSRTNTVMTERDTLG